MAEWDPFGENVQLADRLGVRFEDEPIEQAAAGTPLVDLFEDDEGLLVEIEMAGVRAEDVAVHVTQDRVIVEAERSFTRNGREVLQVETRYGQLHWEMDLPIRAEANGLTAELRLGLLRIRIPRRRATSDQTRRIELEPSGAGARIFPKGS